MSARVIVLAGPSGSGKSRLAERLGLPVLRLDDYYKAQDAPDLPRVTTGANAGMVDWDDPRTWRLEDAVAGIAELCSVGHTDVPVYSIPESRPVGMQHLEIGEHPYFVAEGIFAAEVVEQCERQGLLARAYCVRQHPLVTFWRRLTRDLQEHRKPPLVLVRRGLALLRDQRRVVEQATSKGCVPIHPDEAFIEIGDLVGAGVPGR